MSAGRAPERPWDDFDLVQRAAAYAAEVHRADVRKGSAVPYLAHLWSVAALTLEHGGDDEQVAAALLHDTVEDHGGASRLADVRDRFGPQVAELVEALSDSLADTTAGEAKAPWQERKTAYLRHLERAGERVALVSACDKLHNARSLAADLRTTGPATWSRFNEPDPARQLWYYDGLVAALADKVPAPLADELARTVAEVRRLSGIA